MRGSGSPDTSAQASAAVRVGPWFPGRTGDGLATEATPREEDAARRPRTRPEVEWVNVAGLGFDIVGAAVLSYGLFLSKAGAIELGVSRLSGLTDEENLQLPAVRDRLRQSRNAKAGLALLVVGFGLQIVAAWPT